MSPIPGPRAPGATLKRHSSAPASTATSAAQADGAAGTCARARWLPDLVASLLLLGAALALFRLSLFQGWTFVGDSDRLTNIVNLRLFEVTSLLKRGAVPAWSEYEFMGYGVSGVHWMLPGAPPLAQILALLPLDQFYHALAFLAAGLFTCALGAAYWALGAYTSNPVQRVAGALLYATASYTVHKLMQLDLSFVALVAPPILHRLVFSARRDTAHWTFLAMSACWAFLVLFTVLQELAYLGMFWGLYALYRTIRLRDPWPLLATTLAFGAGVLIGVPRILTIATDLAVTARTSTNIQTTAVEALRYFGDGLLGRTQGEQGTMRGPGLNTHEGVQLLCSSLAALAVIAYGVLAPSRWLRFWGVTLVVVLSVALNAYFRPFYELESLGLRGVAYPSRELRTVLINSLLLGMPLWLLGWLLTRRAAATPKPATTSGARDAAADDLQFLFGFVVVALAIVLIPEARLLFYYGFMKLDFLHSRISVAMSLPLAIVATLFLGRLLPARLTVSGMRWLVAGVALGVVLWLGQTGLADLATVQLGPVVDALRPWRLITVEVVRVLASLLLLLVVATLLLTRHARGSWLTVAGGVVACWMVLETASMAEHRLNGPRATAQPRPFDNLDYLQVPPGQMRVPSLAERAALSTRLEADRYRTVLLQPRDTFLAKTDSHLTAFWDLRLVEGYSTGSPRRLGELPWSGEIFEAHHTDISSTTPVQDLPWDLLAALNVKYVVNVDRSLWFNPAPGGPVAPFDVARLDVLENPRPVTPRAFFAAQVDPAGESPRIPGDDGKRPAPKNPPIEPLDRRSVAEGFPDARQFATAGTIDAVFDGDRVHVRVEPAADDRFLVLNEMYHPVWRARVDGVAATIYPTNVVMRGIVVPAGATSVELAFEPFIFSTTGYAIVALGVVLVGLVTWGLRRLDLVPRAPFAVRRRMATSPDGRSAVSSPR